MIDFIFKEYVRKEISPKKWEEKDTFSIHDLDNIENHLTDVNGKKMLKSIKANINTLSALLDGCETANEKRRMGMVTLLLDPDLKDGEIEYEFYQ